jgi:hypothetical protein
VNQRLPAGPRLYDRAATQLAAPPASHLHTALTCLAEPAPAASTCRHAPHMARSLIGATLRTLQRRRSASRTAATGRSRGRRRRRGRWGLQWRCGTSSSASLCATRCALFGWKVGEAGHTSQSEKLCWAWDEPHLVPSRDTGTLMCFNNAVCLKR